MSKNEKHDYLILLFIVVIVLISFWFVSEQISSKIDTINDVGEKIDKDLSTIESNFIDLVMIFVLVSAILGVVAGAAVFGIRKGTAPKSWKRSPIGVAFLTASLTFLIFLIYTMFATSGLLITITAIIAIPSGLVGFVLALLFKRKTDRD